MTKGSKEQPRLEFFSGRWDWGALGSALMNGGPIALIFIVLWLYCIVIGPFILLGSAAQRLPRTFAVAGLLLGIAGFALFSIAKLSLFRSGHWLAFGSSLMAPRDRRMYRWGYGLMALSVAIALILELIVRGVEF